MHKFYIKIKKYFLTSEEQQTLETIWMEVLEHGADLRSSKMELMKGHIHSW